MKKLDLNLTIYQLVNLYPEFKEQLTEIGFSEIAKPGMLNTVGRFIKLRQGCSLRKLNYEEVIDKLRSLGYTIEEEKE
ncbi:MAG: DUF1858 domain-containing protein [Bacilli bacterium]|nr:DUF1858 domain-containing protein [Bacilli bacterium]MBN2696154.1 DUF1858 domain-containing protein [Bacilli bacterium]